MSGIDNERQEWKRKDEELATIIKQLENDPLYAETVADTVADLAAFYSLRDKKGLSDLKFVDPQISDIITEIYEDIDELKQVSKTSMEFKKFTILEVIERIRCKCRKLPYQRRFSELSKSSASASPYSFDLDFDFDFEDDDDELITSSKVKKAVTKTLAQKLKTLRKDQINYKVVVAVFGKYADEKIKNQYTKKGMLQRRYIIQTFLDKILKLIEGDVSVKDLEEFIDNFFHEVYTDAFFRDYNQQTSALWCDHTRVHGADVPAYADEFLTIKEYAFKFVDDLLAEAVSKVDVTLVADLDVDSEEKEMTSKEPSVQSSIYTGMYEIILTPKDGRDQIKQIVDTWGFPKRWVYCIDFLGETSDSCAEFYKYEVKFSSPSKMYPIPQVTASVFFTIEKSRIKPYVCTPKITYNFETERYKFKPTDKIHHHQFLEDIMQSKLAFFKKIRF